MLSLLQCVHLFVSTVHLLFQWPDWLSSGVWGPGSLSSHYTRPAPSIWPVVFYCQLTNFVYHIIFFTPYLNAPQLSCCKYICPLSSHIVDCLSLKTTVQIQYIGINWIKRKTKWVAELMFIIVLSFYYCYVCLFALFHHKMVKVISGWATFYSLQNFICLPVCFHSESLSRFLCHSHRWMHWLEIHSRYRTQYSLKRFWIIDKNSPGMK